MVQTTTTIREQEPHPSQISSQNLTGGSLSPITTASVVLQNVSKFYNVPRIKGNDSESGARNLKLAANEDISLEVRQGEIFGLLGANGAGKTTLVNQILGLVTPDHGSVWVEGVDVVRYPQKIKSLTSYLPQKSMDFGTLEVERLLVHAGELRGMSRNSARDQAERFIEELDLTSVSTQYFSTLSGGMKRIVGLAMSLMGQPKLLVLDEPTNELDPARRRRVWEFIRSIKVRFGTTCIIVTHNVAEAEAVLERVAVLAEGRLVTLGTPGELKQQFSKEVKLEVVFKPSILDRKTQITNSLNSSDQADEVGSILRAKISIAFEASSLAHGVRFVSNQIDPLSLTIFCPTEQADEVLGVLLHQIGLKYLDDFKLALPSLEEIYLDIVGRPTTPVPKI